MRKESKMMEEFKYCSGDVITQEDTDDALYIANQNAYVLKDALDRIEQLEKEIKELKEKLR